MEGTDFGNRPSQTWLSARGVRLDHPVILARQAGGNKGRQAQTQRVEATRNQKEIENSPATPL
jgi:hypothetical protein